MLKKSLNAKTPGRNAAKLIGEPCGSASSRPCVNNISPSGTGNYLLNLKLTHHPCFVFVDARKLLV